MLHLNCIVSWQMLIFLPHIVVVNVYAQFDDICDQFDVNSIPIPLGPSGSPAGAPGTRGGEGGEAALGRPRPYVTVAKGPGEPGPRGRDGAPSQAVRIVKPKQGDDFVEGRWLVALDAFNAEARLCFTKKYSSHFVMGKDYRPIVLRVGASAVYLMELTYYLVEAVSCEEGVQLIEAEFRGNTTSCLKQVNARAKNWGLARIDERPLFPNDDYTYDSRNPLCKERITAYVVDTGIAGEWRQTEFRGRWRRGIDVTEAGNAWEDANGHGTHVAGILGSSTYGVAKNVVIVPVRISIPGSVTWSTVIGALDLVIKDVKRRKLQNKAVVNFSYGGATSILLNNKINEVVANEITFVAAAGNQNTDACCKSGSSAFQAITVGCTNDKDEFCSFSNWGKCVHILASGENITSLSNDGTGTRVISGTSMSTPHVTGAAAVHLERACPDGLIPAEVRSRLLTTASNGLITGVRNINTPNRLLNLRCSNAGTDSPTMYRG